MIAPDAATTKASPSQSVGVGRSPSSSTEPTTTSSSTEPATTSSKEKSSLEPEGESSTTPAERRAMLDEADALAKDEPQK